MPVARSSLAFFVFLSSLGACSDDPAKTCEATLCDAAAPTTCSGNDIRRCEGGSAYSYTTCGAQARCDDADGSAECVPRACTNVGLSTCKTPIQVEKCLDDGSARETIDCSSTEECVDGRCVDRECTGGDVVCTDAGFMTCSQGDWTTSACPPGLVCSVSGGTASCGPKVCTPSTFRCVGDGSRFCDALGASEIGTPCEGIEVCVDGRCQAQVCGVDTPDATAADTNDSDAQLVPAQMTFKVAGQSFTFDQSVFAEHDSSRNLLSLESRKGTRDILMLIENARQTETGTFTDETLFNRGVVCWNDGGEAQTFNRCPDGYTHQSTLHTITIVKNEGRGGRVEGSFSATVNDENGDPTIISDGTFILNFR